MGRVSVGMGEAMPLETHRDCALAEEIVETLGRQDLKGCEPHAAGHLIGLTEEPVRDYVYWY